jgi:NAD(P)-dependent dehydrogenase (short-subunit alcohol dehydrogenase family)
MKRLVLEGKVAVVTGGARGIGRAICERYVEEGAKVAVADIDLKESEVAAKAMGESAFAVQLDVGRQESIDAMVSGVVERAGSLDVLVNNAGIVSIGPFLEITPQTFDRIFAVNVKGLLFTLKAAAQQMIKQGRGGKVINMASQAGRRGEALVAVYCASKAAVISITQSAGLALIKDKINVNGISPGVVDTPMWDENDALFAKYENRPLGEKKRIVGESVPYGRMGLPADHAGAAVFLASSDSDYVVAQTSCSVNGGWKGSSSRMPLRAARTTTAPNRFTSLPLRSPRWIRRAPAIVSAAR